jgi:hypothetical protein
MTTKKEKEIRNYALYLALLVRRRGDVLTLSERYPPKRKIGQYRSWAAVDRAIERHNDDLLAGRAQFCVRPLSPQARRLRSRGASD